MKRPYNAEQRILDFNPSGPTPEESAQLRRVLRAEGPDWDPDFKQLPYETLAEFFAAREIHQHQIEVFGSLYSTNTTEAQERKQWEDEWEARITFKPLPTQLTLGI